MIERKYIIKRPLKKPEKRGVTILDAVNDKNLFAEAFSKDKSSWNAWRSLLAALFGLPMSDDQLSIFRECTNRQTPSSDKYKDAYLVCGRRGGKSFTLSLIACYLACFRDWKPYLQRGERATIMVIATDRRQARVIMRFITGLLNNSPLLKNMIEHQTREAIALNNSVQIEIHTSSFKSTRGYTIVAALLDELAYWPTSDESAEPDREVIAALRPGMSMIPDAMLLCASSPYAKRGTLWDAYRKHFGKDSPTLVWQATTRQMNPSVPEAWISAEIEADPAKNTSEYLATFRTDVDTFVSAEVVEACVQDGIYERARQPNIAYVAGVDMSGGSVDSAALAISHYDKSRDTVILDLLREKKAPHSPEAVIQEFSNIIKSYGIDRVKGDRYAGEFPKEQYRKFNITYEPNERSASDLYIDFLPLLNSARVELLDNARCISQLCALERRITKFGTGKDAVGHPPNSHDDLINAAVVSMVNASLPYSTYDPFMGCGSPENSESMAEDARAFRMASLMNHIARYG